MDDSTEVKYTPEKIITAWLSVNSVNMSQSMFIWLRASLHWQRLVLHDPVYTSGHCTCTLCLGVHSTGMNQRCHLACHYHPNKDIYQVSQMASQSHARFW